MFLIVRSPRGGKKISNLWHSLAEMGNVLVRPRKRPMVAGDYLAWKIGYAEHDIKAGDPILIRRSDAQHLKQVMDKSFI